MKLPSQKQIEAAAEAIANERCMRRGSLPINNILQFLPAKLLEEVMEDAKAALEAAAQIP